MRNRFNRLTFSVLFLISLSFISCGGKEEQTRAIAVFVPGVLEGSPTYTMMDTGVKKAAEAAGIEVKTVEGGVDQAAWYNQIAALASENLYELIVTSNPAMSEICAKAAESYPNQEFLVLDGSGLGGPSVAEVRYDHREQAFLIGYFAALATVSGDFGENKTPPSVGIIVGQEYPQMEKEIRPGFEIGLQAVDPNIKLEFRVLGNWYDAGKARELASGLYSEGVNLILTIAGGGNQGVIAAAKEADAYVLWFDSDGTDEAPGVVLASAVVHQERAAEEWTSLWLKGELEMGKSTFVGVREGYVDFPMDGKNIRRHIPEEILSSMNAILEKMRGGELDLSVLDG